MPRRRWEESTVLNLLLESVLTTPITAAGFFACTLASLILGAFIAGMSMIRSRYSKSFLITLATLPAIVQVVIMLVNGNVGTGVAVMGAFSLVRFRSVPGSAKEITNLFLAMAVGLATGMGYIGIAAVLTVLLCGLQLLYTLLRFGENRREEKLLKITIPENLDYTGVFDDLFTAYTTGAQLLRVKTTNLGSLFQLHYRLILRDPAKEKAFLDELRCRNGNLDILLARADAMDEDTGMVL